MLWSTSRIWTLVAMSLLIVSCGSSEEDRPTMAEEAVATIEEQKAALEADVSRALAELEKDLGVLRSEADATGEDFSAEFVHLDQQMSRLEGELSSARVANENDLEALGVDVRRALVDIQEAYAALEVRVADAKESSNST